MGDRISYGGISVIAAATLILCCIFFLGIRWVSGSDTFWHIATGDYILSTRALPRLDPFTFTMADTPWVPTEWLSEVIFASIYKFSGFSGIIVLASLSFTAAFFILFLHALMRSAPPIICLSLLAVVGIDRLQHSLPRPQIFSYIILAYFSLALDGFVSGRSKRIWHLPLLMILWVNLHAGAVSGLLLLGTVIAAEAMTRGFSPAGARDREALKTLVAVFFFTCLAVGANPNGYGLISWVAGHPGVNKAIGNNEFLPMTFADPLARNGLILMCLLGALMALNWRTLEPRDIFPALVFALPALFMRRAGAEFFIVTFPVFVTCASSGTKKVFRLMKWKPGNFSGAAVPTAFLALMAFWRLSFHPYVRHSLGFGVNPQFYPTSAISFIKTDLKGPVYNSIMLGGAFILEAYPRVKAFWDTRLIGDEMYLKAIRAIGGEPVRFQEFLDRYRVEVCLIERSDKGFSRAMFPRKTWALLYWDDWAVVFARRGGVNSMAIRNNEYRSIDPVWIVSADILRDPMATAAAKKDILRELREGPPSGKALTALAQIASREGRPDKAAALLTRAITLNPTNPSVYNSMGTFLARTGDLDRARKYFTLAIDWEPAYSPAYLNLGMTYLPEEDLERAGSLIEKSLSLDPSSPEAHRYLGLVLLRMNRVTDGLSHLSRSLALDPRQESAGEIKRIIDHYTSPR